MTTRSLSLSFALAFATSAALAAPVFQPTVTGPSELELGKNDLFTLTAKNIGTVAASSTLRMLLQGMTVSILPAGCSIDNSGAPALVCSTYLGVGKTKSFAALLQAPTSLPPGSPSMWSGMLQVFAPGAALASSPLLQTQLGHFQPALTLGQPWQMRSCGSSAGPVPYTYCPPSSERVTTVVFDPSGVLSIGGNLYPQYRWTQTGPGAVRMDTVDVNTAQITFTVNYGPLNSLCLRGPGQAMPQPSPVSSASKICPL